MPNNENNNRVNENNLPPFAPPPIQEQPASPYPEGEEQLPTPALPGGNGVPRPPIGVFPIPIFPPTGTRPNQNQNQGTIPQGYCTIRFIHAAAGYGAVNVSIGNKRVVNNLGYGEVSSYFTETDGFKAIRVADTGRNQMVIAGETFLFHNGDVYTIAFINSMNGLAMFLISDAPCRNQQRNFSCVRAVNLSYNSVPLDVTNQTGLVRYEDLRFKTVSAYKQVAQGAQEFYVSETMSGAPMLTTVEQVNAGGMYTLYLIGDVYTVPGITTLFTEDYSGLQR